MNDTLPMFLPTPSKLTEQGCITLVGMAAAGKTTIGRELSHQTGWAQIDSDNLIEAVYGAPLQTITEGMSKDAFLDLERDVLCTITVSRVILSTGGSAVYRPEAMEYLRSLGPIIYLAVPLPVILERIARKPDRGLAIAPGQTIEDLYNERSALYEKYATFTLTGGVEPPSSYAKEIVQWLSHEE